jgi:hypothetical protein
MLAFQRILERSSPFQNPVEHHEDADIPLPELREHVRVQYMVVIKAKHEPWIVRQDGVQVVLGNVGNLEFKALEHRLDVVHGFLARNDNDISHSIQKGLAGSAGSENDRRS